METRISFYEYGTDRELSSICVNGDVAISKGNIIFLEDRSLADRSDKDGGRWKVKAVHKSFKSDEMMVKPTPEWPLPTKYYYNFSIEVYVVRPFSFRIWLHKWGKGPRTFKEAMQHWIPKKLYFNNEYLKGQYIFTFLWWSFQFYDKMSDPTE